jgi:hypothetical protein
LLRQEHLSSICPPNNIDRLETGINMYIMHLPVDAFLFFRAYPLSSISIRFFNKPPDGKIALATSS